MFFLIMNLLQIKYIYIMEVGKMRKTTISLIIMVLSSCIGLFVGGMLNNMVGGMILFALISGIPCIIHTLEKHN